MNLIVSGEGRMCTAGHPLTRTRTQQWRNTRSQVQYTLGRVHSWSITANMQSFISQNHCRCLQTGVEFAAFVRRVHMNVPSIWGIHTLNLRGSFRKFNFLTRFGDKFGNAGGHGSSFFSARCRAFLCNFMSQENVDIPNDLCIS